MIPLGYMFFGTLFIIAVYLMTFWAFVIGNIYLGIKLFKTKPTQQILKLLIAAHFAVPVLGLIGYLFVDYFEASEQTNVWWMGMLALHLTPIVVNIFYKPKSVTTKRAKLT